MNAVLVACARKLKLPNPQVIAVLPAGRRVSVRKVAPHDVSEERYFGGGGGGDGPGPTTPGDSFAAQLVKNARAGVFSGTRQGGVLTAAAAAAAKR
jgi:hypothetical protein